MMTSIIKLGLPFRASGITCALLIILLLLVIVPVPGQAQVGYDYHYSYTYDYWGEVRYAPDAYRVRTVINSATLELDQPLMMPGSLFVDKDRLYIVDTGNHRIIQLLRDGDAYRQERVINSFYEGNTAHTFNTPGDIFVTANGELFIADTGNQRVVKLDQSLKLLMTITKPTDETFDQRLAFMPTRVVADMTGRAFVLIRNMNKGMAKFESDGQFTGFIGAMPVSYSITDQIWRLLSTREQRAQQASFVPTEFDNMYIDSKGFIYSVTTTFQEYDLLWDNARPIRKLNAVGSDILVKNGEFPPIGDVDWGSAAGYNGPSRFSDITVLDNEVYVALDKIRGRLFGYDDQGRNLWIFGGSGNMAGYFRNAASIEHDGYDLLVLDSLEGSVTIFEPTEYGRLIYQATEQYYSGQYSLSADTWQKVLQLNGNFELAYIGVGRALMRAENYEEAMRYFKLANDEANYSKAFQEQRKIWVEQNIVWIFIVIALALLVPLMVGRIRKIKEELREA
ncbi:MAG: hypothetical protein ACOX62_07660 [Christensenellales bacterium]|jgi:tetratricopeptide (TPR) repeat protein